MGSPISPVVANLFIEDFEARALSSSPNPPRIWLMYLDDTFVVHKAEHNQQFLSHLISLIPYIQFTTETPNQLGSFPFLDTLVSIESIGSLSTTVFWKPTYRSILILGEPSQHHPWIHHLQHTYTRGPNCLFKPTVIRTGISACQNCPQQMQISRLGLPQTKMNYKLNLQHHNINPNSQRDTNTNKGYLYSWSLIQKD